MGERTHGPGRQQPRRPVGTATGPGASSSFSDVQRVMTPALGRSELAVLRHWTVGRMAAGSTLAR